MIMKKIDSFTINHLALVPGVYLSRRDRTPSGDIISTYDVRLTAPNREPAVSPQALHTIEHLAATYLRNHPDWKDRTVYWGPMGCCTGCYLIVQGEPDPEAELVPLLREVFGFIASFEGEIPGASARDCGNYTYNDLPAARAAASAYLHHLETPVTTYPK